MDELASKANASACADTVLAKSIAKGQLAPVIASAIAIHQQIDAHACHVEGGNSIQKLMVDQLKAENFEPKCDAPQNLHQADGRGDARPSKYVTTSTPGMTEPPLPPASRPKTAAAPNGGGDCSTITGLGGGSGPSNCTPPNGIPPTVQAQMAQARSNMQAAQTIQQSDPGAASRAAAAAQFRLAAAAFQTAGDALQAAAAADQAKALEGTLSCPPLAPASFWQGTTNADYCANANCVDRGSALYGMLCYPDSVSNKRELGNNEMKQLCARKLEILKPHAPDDAWLEEQMARGDLACQADGSPMSLRERTRRALQRGDTLKSVTGSAQGDSP